MRANGRRLQGLGGQGGAMRKGSGDLQWGTRLLWGRGTKKGPWKGSNRWAQRREEHQGGVNMGTQGGNGNALNIPGMSQALSGKETGNGSPGGEGALVQSPGRQA